MRFSPLLLAISLVAACRADSDPVAAAALAVQVVDHQQVLIPPAAFPVRDDAYVTDPARGKSQLMRRTDGVVGQLELHGQTPGHVLVYATIAFNHPEHCLQGDDRLPRHSPCRGNGPLDPRDAAIPDVAASADAWASVLANGGGNAHFRVDFANDLPTERLNQGPGIMNAMGAVVYMYVMDKGPLAPEGPLRTVQRNTLYGGCQGPPAFGPLPCRGVAIALHLPDES